jgi:hypothetical protein
VAATPTEQANLMDGPKLGRRKEAPILREYVCLVFLMAPAVFPVALEANVRMCAACNTA